MKLTEAQAKIVLDGHRFRVLVCGRKFGKTTLASEEIKGCAFHRQGIRVLYVAPTLDDARRLMWDRIRKEFGNVAEKVNDTRLELVIPTQYGGPSNIFLGSWEKVDNYRGDEYDLVVFDEVQDYRGFWVGWNEAMRPTLTPRQGVALFMGTPKGFNHFYDLSNLELGNDSFKTHRYTTYDNPHIPLSEIEEAKRLLPEDQFNQEYMGSFVKSSGVVFKEFNRERHLYDKLPDNDYKYWGGIDFGFRNPACVLHTYFDNRRLWIEEEWYKTERTDAELADYVKLQGFNAVYPDPESQGGIEELKRRQVNVREVKKAKGSILAGNNSIRELFIRGDIKINKNKCPNLVSELEMYSYEDNADKINENPRDEFNHAISALRYIVSSNMSLIFRQEYFDAQPRFYKVKGSKEERVNPAR